MSGGCSHSRQTSDCGTYVESAVNLGNNRLESAWAKGETSLEKAFFRSYMSGGNIKSLVRPGRPCMEERACNLEENF